VPVDVDEAQELGAGKQSKGFAEQIDGHAVATRIRIPLMFWLAGMPISNEARIEKAMQKDMHPRGTPKSVDIPFKSGQALALDSPFVKQPSG